MLVRFSLENWKSFRDRVEISMLASRERQHGERLFPLKKYQNRLLPIAVLYGGNASGKSNLFEALTFIKSFVLLGTRMPDAPVGVQPFLLEREARERPVRFSLEILIDGTIYCFEFGATSKAVVEEKLVKILSNRELVLYERSGGEIKFDPEKIRGREERDFLKYVARGTRSNQLFLTNSILQSVEKFRPVYDWFKNTLSLIGPASRFQPYEKLFGEDAPLGAYAEKLLARMDTGICRLDTEMLESLPVPEHVKADLEENIQEGQIVTFSTSLKKRLIVARKDGALVAKKPVAIHRGWDGEDVSFDLRQESDGTCRLLDLLPAFKEPSSPENDKVICIDELGRSLHPLLTRRLLELHLSNCGNRRQSQLLVTTHDILTIDQSLLRRDEMWVTERDARGVSRLYSFGDYKEARYDEDLRKSYLKGRMGGVPRIFLSDISESFGESFEEEAEG